METLFHCLGGIIGKETDFLKMVLSFHSDKDSADKRALRELWTRKATIGVHIIFLLVVLADLVITNLYSSSIFPFYTANILKSFQWGALGSEMFVYILFGLSLCVGCICCLSCCVGCIPCYWFVAGEINSATNSLNGLNLYGACITCIGVPLLFIIPLVLFMVIFCFCPSIGLYLVLLFYTLVNDTRITQLYLNTFSDSMVANAQLIDHAMHIVSNCGDIGPIHYRMGQYLIGYLLWPMDHDQYHLIRSKLLSELKTLFECDIDVALKNLVENCASNDMEISTSSLLQSSPEASANNVVAQFVRNDQLSFSPNYWNLIETQRMRNYGIFCAVIYILILVTFWICYFYSDLNGDADRMLFLFYVFSQCLYVVLLVAMQYLLWKQLALYLRKRFGWILRMCYDENGHFVGGDGEYKFVEHKFITFYNLWFSHYVTWHCLTKLLQSDRQWMRHIILEYIVPNDVQQLIDSVYADKGDAERDVVYDELEMDRDMNTVKRAKVGLYDHIPTLNASFAAFCASVECLALRNTRASFVVH